MGRQLKNLVSRRTLFVLLLVIVVATGAAYAYHRHTAQSSLKKYPQGYPYSCNFNLRTVDGPVICDATEDEGKVKLAQRPEVEALVGKFGRKGVIIRALEFQDVQDKAFLKGLLGDNYVELGCIIEVAYPDGRYVYLENDKLDVIQRLDGAQFDQWLRAAPADDVQKYYRHLH